MANTFTFLDVNGNTVSTDTGSSVVFTIKNSSNKPLTLYWVDRDGKQQAYGSVGQGEGYRQESLSTHVWWLKSADGLVNLKFEPSVAGQLTVGADLSPSVIDFSEHVIQTPNGLWSTAQGYGLIDIAKSLGVDDVADLPVNGQNNNMALNAINASSAWAAGITGKGVKVAVVDSGIAANPEIDDRIVGGYDFYQKDDDPSPDNGNYRDHSLGVAAIIAGSHSQHSGRDTMGVAPDALLLNVRVGGSQGSNTADMAAGIRYAVDQGAKVICMPLQSDGADNDPALIEAVHYAYTHNVVTVIIGGNFGTYGATGPALIAKQLPGELIAVGNYNVPAGAPFDSSNTPGDTPFPWVMAGSSGYVPTASGEYKYWQDGGTSFAGPYVAGLAALLWEQNPDATAAEIIKKILAGASIGENAGTGELSKIVGTANADVLQLVAGVAVDGGGGVDLLQVTGDAGDFSIAATSTGFALTNKVTNTVSLLTSVERLQFSDKFVALDIDGSGGAVYRLYQAAFDRTPDMDGLGYWMSAMDKGAALTSVASSFVNSDEFKQLFGEEPTDVELVNAMYQNVLHRAPDQQGEAYWIDSLKNGTTAADMLTAFSASRENVANVAKIIGQGFEYLPPA
nr:S8 family serine peptidase [uncultured Duganella sp.]